MCSFSWWVCLKGWKNIRSNSMRKHELLGPIRKRVDPKKWGVTRVHPIGSKGCWLELAYCKVGYRLFAVIRIYYILQVSRLLYNVIISKLFTSNQPKELSELTKPRYFEEKCKPGIGLFLNSPRLLKGYQSIQNRLLYMWSLSYPC